MFVCPRSVRLQLGAVIAAFVVGTGGAFAAPAPPTLNAPVVAGPRVTLSWSASPGALGYRLAIGITPGTDDYAQVVGNVTSVTFTVPFTGTGYVRAQAFDASGLSAPSNEVVLTVTTMTRVPAAPVDLRAVLVGRDVALSWAAGQGGGPPLGVLIEAGTAPGLANLGTTALPLSTSVTAPNVPPGTYFVRVYAVNGSGRSDPSNELRVDMPVGGGCTAPGATALSVTASGGAVAMSWAAVGGAAGYRLEVASAPSGAIVLTQALGSGVTSFNASGAPAGDYYARIVAVTACGAETPSAVVSFTVTNASGSGPRTPNPPPGQRLPLPNMSSVVEAIGNAYRGELLNSCVEHGGNNAWLFRVVQELRRHDSRWGLNWKRGRVGDMSQDVVDYNFSVDPDEGTTNVYIIDIIGGHCGSNPGPAWIDVTEATRAGGTIGRWTLQPFIAAGGRP
jgi:hypothetical protein